MYTVLLKIQVYNVVLKIQTASEIFMETQPKLVMYNIDLDPLVP